MHIPVDLTCVFQVVTATVSSAKAPVSAPAVKGHFSSWKPSVSRNVGRGTLQIIQTADAQVTWRLCCVLWKEVRAARKSGVLILRLPRRI